jgi:hypothetical protein
MSVRFTDILTKTKPICVNWTSDDDIAVMQLKTALCYDIKSNLCTGEWVEAYGIYCCASHIAVILSYGIVTMARYRFLS